MVDRIIAGSATLSVACAAGLLKGNRLFNPREMSMNLRSSYGISRNGQSKAPARRSGRCTAEMLESRTLLSVSASAQLNLLSTAGTAQSPIYNYGITLTDTGNTNVGSFWFAWVPGFDFLPTVPLSKSAPTGWTANVAGAGQSFDGSSIQYVATSNALTAGHSLGGFNFSSHDSPSTLAAISSFSSSHHVMDSFVYSGGLFSDLGFQLTVAPVATGPVAKKLAIASQPSTQVAGKVLAPIVVDVDSATGTLINTDHSQVAVSITGPGGLAIGSTNVVTAAKGVATFSNLKLNTAGTYTLKFTDGTLTSAVSKTITITPATAAKLAFAPQPVTGTAGKALTPAVMVKVEDTFGNVVTTNTSNVKISISSSPAGATLTGTLSANAVKGIATFNNAVLKKTGSYRLKATDGLLTAGTSGSITISAATAAKLVITQQPTTGKANIALTPALIAKVEDAFGNVVTTNATLVTLTIASGPAGAALGGTFKVNAVKGVATFSNVKLSKTGTFTLKAIDGLLTAAVSKQIVVS